MPNKLGIAVLTGLGLLCLAAGAHVVVQAGDNLLRADGWEASGLGFLKEDAVIFCDNGADTAAVRGAVQQVELNQTKPEPITAVAWSRAEGIGGIRDFDYSLYLDLIYDDGTPLWAQVAPFDTGTHDWQRREVIVWPEKPVKTVRVNLLLRKHAGKAWFKDVELRTMQMPAGAALFDGVAVIPETPCHGFRARDVAANSDFTSDIEKLGLKLEVEKRERGRLGVFFDATLTDTTGADRALTLAWAARQPADKASWLNDPTRAERVEPGREYLNATASPYAGRGKFSMYPFGAVSLGEGGRAIGIDPQTPAFFRVGFSGTSELYIAYDIALTPEKPSARVSFCFFEFTPGDFRGALEKYYELYPQAFEVRAKKQGVWMPFAKISGVEAWEDFGFRFKEGDNETAWDDAHDIVTFRYTEPMTWWMPMPPQMPRTIEAATGEAKRLAAEGNASARALLASGFKTEGGSFFAHMLDTPWCNGAVWSMNSCPGIAGEVTDFKTKWNDTVRESLYGPGKAAALDGEYIDSSEGYVTDELDFCREHFAGADRPLVWARGSCKPGVFRCLVAYEYARGIERDVHAMGKLMMANGTPWNVCWLAPLFDVMGNETNWKPDGNWDPMKVEDLLYRRALCGAKPFCFLMNTPFEKWTREDTERYMKRCLAFGMFPGFFSHNASSDHYFTQPALYNRDRELFKKYVPVIRKVAEAGWQPVTRARADDEAVVVERFGERYLTVFNPSGEQKTFNVVFDEKWRGSLREMLSGTALEMVEGSVMMTVGSEDVAVLEREGT